MEENELHTLEELEIMLDSKFPSTRIDAILELKDRSYVPIGLIKKAFEDDHWTIRSLAIELLGHRKDIPWEWLRKALTDEDNDVRYAAIMASAGRYDIFLDWIKDAFEGFDSELRDRMILHFIKQIREANS